MSPIRGWVKRRRSSKKEKESLGTGTESTTLRESISPVVDLGSLAFAVTFEDGYGVNAGEREIPSSMDNAANETQSHDDITWGNRNGPEDLMASTSRSIPNLQELCKSTETRPPQRLAERLHAQRLRAKFSLWFKEARLAIRARVKSRKATGRGDDDLLQLTTAT